MNILIYYQISTFFISHHLTILEKKTKTANFTYAGEPPRSNEATSRFTKGQIRIRRAPVWKMKSKERPAPQMNMQ